MTGQTINPDNLPQDARKNVEKSRPRISKYNELIDCEKPEKVSEWFTIKYPTKCTEDLPRQLNVRHPK